MDARGEPSRVTVRLPSCRLKRSTACAFLLDHLRRLRGRAEQETLDARAEQIADLTGAGTVVELGSGTSDKTRRLLDALLGGGHLRRFVPFDVAELALRDSAAAISRRLPGVEVTGMVGDFEQHLSEIPDHGRTLIVFFGGTIGNLAPDARRALLGSLRATMRPADALLLGTDLVEDRERLVAAYDDASGTTERFNKNVLAMLNRELAAADLTISRWWTDRRGDYAPSLAVPSRGIG